MAEEGRQRGLRAEELLIALKSVEQRVAPMDAGDDARAVFRMRLIQGLLAAFYKE